MDDGGRPQEPVPEPDEPNQPLRGPTWARRELTADERDGDHATGSEQAADDEDRRHTPDPADITDHAP